MTRARQHLHLIEPIRLFKSHQYRYGDGRVLATRSRFIQDRILKLFERRARGEAAHRFGRGDTIAETALMSPLALAFRFST